MEKSALRHQVHHTESIIVLSNLLVLISISPFVLDLTQSFLEMLSSLMISFHFVFSVRYNRIKTLRNVLENVNIDGTIRANLYYKSSACFEYHVQWSQST